jgi:hypothetical protein
MADALQLPTVRVKHATSPVGYAVINRSDYDSSVHDLFDDEPASESEAGDAADAPAADAPVADKPKRRAAARRKVKPAAAPAADAPVAE